MNSGQAMSENKKMVAMPSMTGSMSDGYLNDKFFTFGRYVGCNDGGNDAADYGSYMRSYEDLMVSADGTRIGGLACFWVTQ
ncbi:MAG: hypothetical protein CM15mP85_11290 [Rhodobacterales bacterium]|nr:MAG: hypothetical protein CM15mP85_11290 [Rhodobacterales bacterium]